MGKPASLQPSRSSEKTIALLLPRPLVGSKEKEGRTQTIQTAVSKAGPHGMVFGEADIAP
jgi:hypothetical protein